MASTTPRRSVTTTNAAASCCWYSSAIGRTVGGSDSATPAFNFGRSATRRAMTVNVWTSVAVCWSTSVPASISPRCNSASASRVVVRLTKYTANAIDSTASAALARKMRLVSEPRIVIYLSRASFVHLKTKSASTAPPSSGTVICRDSRTAPSFQAFST